jgi:type IX secretion system PorP/SprF family membrane protein
VANGRLGLGIAGSYINREIDADWNPVHDPLSSDLAIPPEKESDFAFDLGVGLFYHTEELYVGLSSTRLLENEYRYQQSSSGTSVSKEKLKRHFYVTAGYTIPMSNPALEFLPSFFIQSDLKVTKIHLNTTFMCNKKFWAGVSYRVDSDMIGMIGLNILNGVKVGYSYDFQTRALSNASKGSHEIMIGYSFLVGIDKIPQKYKSIRYL